MLRPDHEALLQGAIDGTLTPEERDALRQLLAHDAEARERVGELGRLNALLASLGTAEAPQHLVDDVLARVSPHTAAPQPISPFSIRRPIPKRGEIVNKKLIFGLAAAAVVILAVITYTSYPPATEGTEATIGAAQRAQTPQIASKDVGLGDTSAQDVLQSETWDAIMKDEDLRSTLQDAEARQMLADSDLREALKSNDVREALHEAQLGSYLQDYAARAKKMNEAALRGNARIDAALRNKAFENALRKHGNLAAFLSRPATAKALGGEAMKRLLADRNFEAALRSGGLERQLATMAAKKAQ